MTFELSPLDDLTDDFYISMVVKPHSLARPNRRTQSTRTCSASGWHRNSSYYCPREEGNEVLVEEIKLKEGTTIPLVSRLMHLTFNFVFRFSCDTAVSVKIESTDMGDLELLGFAIELKTPQNRKHTWHVSSNYTQETIEAQVISTMNLIR